MKTNKTPLFLVILVFLIACNDNKKNEQSIKQKIEKPKNNLDLLDGIWNLYKVNDTIFDINKLYDFEAEKPTLKIEAHRNFISGFSGCNSYSANVKIDNYKITLTGGIMATQQGCGGNVWENDYFSRLDEIQSYELKKDTLKIQSSNNKSMTFLRRHLHPLEFNRWELTKVNDTIFDIKKVYGNKNEPQPVIMFNFEKNTVSGWNGCNGFGLSINFNGDYYTSGMYNSDARGCYKGWLEKFNGILADNQSYRIKEEILTLTNSKGNTLTFKKLRQ